MYWKTIGTSVRAVYEHTYLYNRIWGHPIYPIGQTYEAPGNGGLRLFRRFAASYGGLAPSWWDWQETDGAEWGALGAAAALRPLPGYRPEVAHPLLKTGAKGDMVVWAQEHLVAAGAERADHRHLRQADPRSGARLPGRAWAAGRRPDRHRHLGAR